MSERYGDCRRCGGRGHKLEVVHEDRAPNGVQVTKLGEKPETVSFDGPHVIVVAKPIECGSCGGTGHSGDAMDLPNGV